MVGNKTQSTDGDVTGFLEKVEDHRQREDSFELVEIMSAATGEKPKMWGASTIGFGEVHLKYDSGRELDWFKVGFSPRKSNISLYLPADLDGVDRLLDGLGKHTKGKACVYIKRLEDVDRRVLVDLVRAAAGSATT